MLSIYDSNSPGSPTLPILEVASDAVETSQTGDEREENISLAPEEIATLASLVKRYDQLLLDVDALNLQIEEILKTENPAPDKKLENY